MRVLAITVWFLISCGDDTNFIDSSFPDDSGPDASLDAEVDARDRDAGPGTDASTRSCSVERVVDIVEMSAPPLFDVAASADFVITWDETRDGQSDIFARAYGERLEDEVRITDSFDRSEAPAVLAFDDAVWLAYQDNRELDFEIWFERRTSSNLTLVDSTRVTERAGRDELPTLSWLGSSALITWLERDGGTSHLEVESIAQTGELSGSPNDVVPDRTPTRPRLRPWDDGAALAFFEPAAGGGDAYVTVVSSSGAMIATSRISSSSDVTGGVDIAYRDAGGVAVFDTSNAVLEPSVNVAVLDATGTPVGTGAHVGDRNQCVRRRVGRWLGHRLSQ